jgi:pilus assembly protein CpaE
VAGNLRKNLIAAIALDADVLATLSKMLDGAKYELAPPIHHYAGDSADLYLLENLRRNPPDIFVVDFDVNPDRAKRTVHQIRTVLPAATVFAASSQSAPDQIINAMRCGCSEYLVKPFDAARLNQALAEFEKVRRDESKPTHRAEMVTMLGVKGGVGVTTLAVHLASFVARMNGGKTLLIDQHPDLGDVAVYLGLGQQRHQYHFYELVANVHRLDEELLQGFVHKHESGLHVLSSPDTFDTMKLAANASIDSALELLRSFYEYIIIDCAPGLVRFNISCIDKSDKVCLVTTPEVPAVRNLSRYLDHLGRFNCPEEKVDVVINRDSKRNAISRQQVEKAIKRPVSHAIPNDYNELIEAVNAGRPLLPEGNSELITSLRLWAQFTMHGEAAAAAASKPQAKKRFGILGL